MKKTIPCLRNLAIIALLALVAGCSTVQDTENLLVASGFKIVPATTPEQEAALKNLAADKVAMVPRNGTTYFVYPDPAHKVLYVGQQAQYQEFQRLRHQNQMAEEKLEAAELNSQPDWGVWAPWDGPMAVPMIRR